jgi:hypothetical protein
MKINVVKDKSGKIVASFPERLEGGLQVHPVLTEGHKVELIEAPENYHSNPSLIHK